jgi:hypothetical protein
MPVVINGSTGVSLADTNAVPTAAIQANAVTFAKLLSTDWTNSQAATGYQKLPSGVIVQWGSWNGGAAASGTNSFPLTFPNGVFSMIFGTSSNGTAGYGAPISNSQYNWNRNSGTSNSGTWVAFGY